MVGWLMLLMLVVDGKHKLSALIGGSLSTVHLSFKRGARKLTGEILKVVWAELSTLS